MGPMPPLTDLIEQLTCPAHPQYRRDPHGRDLTPDERRELRNFCRDGLAAVGLLLPPRYPVHGLVMLACHVRAIVRFGCDDKSNQQIMAMLTMIFHPNVGVRKAAAANDGWLWDEDKQRPIIDYHRGGEISNLTANVLIRDGIPYGTA
jgi:hypothetical protein